MGSNGDLSSPYINSSGDTGLVITNQDVSILGNYNGDRGTTSQADLYVAGDINIGNITVFDIFK